MTDALAPLVLLGIGVLIGRYSKRIPLRALGIAAMILVGAPVAVFIVAMSTGSEVLGWIGGLGLMVVVALALPMALGFALGRLLRKLQGGSNDPVLQPAQPAVTPAQSSREAAPARVRVASSQGRVPFPRGMLLMAASVAAGFWVVIALGFRLHDQPAPAGLDAGLVPAAIVLIVTVAMGVRHVIHNFSNLKPSLPLIQFGGWSYARKQRERLASLAADPKRARYAAMIAAGDSFWTDERIAYDLDRSATTCCAHLSPIEAAMRMDGIDVRLSGEGTARAACRVDVDALGKQFALPDCVGYGEFQIYDRSVLDPPDARILCATCNSVIWVVHPSQGSASTAVFPR